MVLNRLLCVKFPFILWPHYRILTFIIILCGEYYPLKFVSKQNNAVRLCQKKGKLIQSGQKGGKLEVTQIANHTRRGKNVIPNLAPLSDFPRQILQLLFRNFCPQKNMMDIYYTFCHFSIRKYIFLSNRKEQYESFYLKKKPKNEIYFLLIQFDLFLALICWKLLQRSTQKVVPQSRQKIMQSYTFKTSKISKATKRFFIKLIVYVS